MTKTLSTILIMVFLLIGLSLRSLAQSDSTANHVFTAQDTTIHSFVEKSPMYPGGMGALQKFIEKNLKYPTEAIRKNIQGFVVVNFVVNKDGSLSNITTESALSQDCINEAKRIISIMPRWIPGTQKEKTVRARFVLPVRFKL